MALRPFDGPKLKLARGRKHAACLNDELTVYLRRDPWAILVLRDNERKTTGISLLGRESIPEDFVLVAGDAIHNFRAALDVLANDVVALGSVKPNKVYFPFSENEEGFEKQLKEKMGQAPEDVKAIVRSFKPYKGGNETLRAMHDLDIGDKHITLLSAAQRADTGPLPMKRVGEFKGEDGEMKTRFSADFSESATTRIDATGFSLGKNIECLGKLKGSQIDLTVALGLPLAGQPISKVLVDMGDLTENIIQTFEAHFKGCGKA